ncbi:CaaX protease, partial [Cladorrhinum samala]
MAALDDVLYKLNPWQKDPSQPPPTPPLQASTAYLLVSLYALLYFIPFYLSPLTRPSPTLSRDDPSAIRARIRSVTISTLLCLIATYLILTYFSRSPITPSHAFHLLGFYPLSLYPALKSLFLTSLLFLGPLYSYFIIDEGYQPWLSLEPLKDCWTTWQYWRNYVV